MFRSCQRTSLKTVFWSLEILRIRHLFVIIPLLMSSGLLLLYTFSQLGHNLFANPSFENLLCVDKIPLELMSSLNVTDTTCPTNGVVTVEQGGRLGNMIWEMASVWGFSEEYGYSPYLPVCLLFHLNSVFEKIDIPTFTNTSDCEKNLEKRKNVIILSRKDIVMNEIQNEIVTSNTFKTLVILKIYIALFEVVLPRLQKLKEMLKFRKDIIIEKDITLGKILSEVNIRFGNSTNALQGTLHRAQVNLVCVHVRRTDYRQYLAQKMNRSLARPRYFSRAMNYFRSKYSSNQTLVFLVLSDDIRWCKKYLLTSGDVIVAPEGKSSGHDLALLSSCNHSIIDYGTYGMTGAMLAGGETIVYDLGGHLAQTMATMMPNWRVLR